MTALTEFLFPAPARRDARSILAWWERRRLPFNLAVGAAGAASTGLVMVLLRLPPYGLALGAPWQPIVIFGVMANVCYCFGPSIELALERLGRGRLLPVGPTLFRMGLTFSVGLALLPSLLAGFSWCFRLLRWMLF